MTSGRLAPTRAVDDKDTTTTVAVAEADAADIGGADKLKRIIRRMRIQVCFSALLLVRPADQVACLDSDLGRYFGRFLALSLHWCRFHRRRMYSSPPDIRIDHN